MLSSSSSYTPIRAIGKGWEISCLLHHSKACCITLCLFLKQVKKRGPHWFWQWVFYLEEAGELCSCVSCGLQPCWALTQLLGNSAQLFYSDSNVTPTSYSAKKQGQSESCWWLFQPGFLIPTPHTTSPKAGTALKCWGTQFHVLHQLISQLPCSCSKAARVSQTLFWCIFPTSDFAFSRLLAPFKWRKKKKSQSSWNLAHCEGIREASLI